MQFFSLHTYINSKRNLIYSDINPLQQYFAKNHLYVNLHMKVRLIDIFFAGGGWVGSAEGKEGDAHQDAAGAHEYQEAASWGSSGTVWTPLQVTKMLLELMNTKKQQAEDQVQCRRHYGWLRCCWSSWTIRSNELRIPRNSADPTTGHQDDLGALEYQKAKSWRS